MTLKQPISIITLDVNVPYVIPAPHKLYIASELAQPIQCNHPIYLILPSKPYTTLSPETTRHLLKLTTLLPSKELILVFPKYLSHQHCLPYETLFSAPSLTSHPARNLLSCLPTDKTITTSLTLHLPSKATLHDLIIIHPRTPQSPKLQDTATLVALGASPPPTHTINAIPGYKLSHIPTKHSATSQFLSHLHTKNYTLLLRFPNNNHLFLHKTNDIWHGLLLPQFSRHSIPFLNPITITKYLKHPPRVPILRPLLHLPVFHKPPTSPPQFQSAVFTVAHQIRKQNPTPLETKILSHRLKHLPQPTETNLKRARFNRLHSRAAQQKPKQSIITPKQKRLKTRYFAVALSAVLSSLTKHPKFFAHPGPTLSWRQPSNQVIHQDPVLKNYGVHGIEFCDEARDSCIRACENLIGKSVAEFAYTNHGKLAKRKIKVALAALRRQISTRKFTDSEPHGEEPIIKSSNNALTVLPSQVEA